MQPNTTTSLPYDRNFKTSLERWDLNELKTKQTKNQNTILGMVIKFLEKFMVQYAMMTSNKYLKTLVSNAN